MANCGVPADARTRLGRFHTIAKPRAFIFPNADGGFVDTDKYRKRTLHTLARDLKLPKLTFQVIRRTIATLALKKAR